MHHGMQLHHALVNCQECYCPEVLFMDILHQLSSKGPCFLLLFHAPFPLLFPCSLSPLPTCALLPACSLPSTDDAPITTKCHTMSRFLSCFKQLPSMKACQPVCIVRHCVHSETTRRLLMTFTFEMCILQVLDHFDHFEDDAKLLIALEDLAEQVSGWMVFCLVLYRHGVYMCSVTAARCVWCLSQLWTRQNAFTLLLMCLLMCTSLLTLEVWLHPHHC